MNKNWRIYRLPGSRENWHVDSGEKTQVFNVLGFQINGASARSVDVGTGVPRAWIEIEKESSELHLIGGQAIWTAAIVDAAIPAIGVAVVEPNTAITAE